MITRQRYQPTEHMTRHRHLKSYAALVLAGGYVEAGDSGRIKAGPGDVIFHQQFEAHRDCFSARGAEILNLELGEFNELAFARCRDPDLVVRLAEHDLRSAAAALLEQCEPAVVAQTDWTDLLARDLATETIELADWARAHGLTASSVSRGFVRTFGVTPRRYRLEVRAAAAARLIVSGSTFANAAYDTGFADQPHLSRALRSLYGLTASQIRAMDKCVQDCVQAGG